MFSLYYLFSETFLYLVQINSRMHLRIGFLLNQFYGQTIALKLGLKRELPEFQ